MSQSTKFRRKGKVKLVEVTMMMKTTNLLPDDDKTPLPLLLLMTVPVVIPEYIPIILNHLNTPNFLLRRPPS